MSFHFLVSFISFTTFCSVQCASISPSWLGLFLNNFFDNMVNRIHSLIFLDNLLLVYRNENDLVKKLPCLHRPVLLQRQFIRIPFIPTTKIITHVDLFNNILSQHSDMRGTSNSHGFTEEGWLMVLEFHV